MKLLEISKIQINEIDITTDIMVGKIYSIINHIQYEYDITNAYEVLELSDFVMSESDDIVLYDLSKISKSERFVIICNGTMIRTYYYQIFGEEELYFDNNASAMSYILDLIHNRKYSSYDFEIKTITTIMDTLKVTKPSTITEMVKSYNCSYSDIIYQLIYHNIITVDIQLSEFGRNYGGDYDYRIIEWDVTLCNCILYNLLFSNNKTPVDLIINYNEYLGDHMQYVPIQSSYTPYLSHKNSFFGQMECHASTAPVLQNFRKHGLYDYDGVSKYGSYHCEKVGCFFTTIWNYYICRLIQYDMYIRSLEFSI